MLRNLLRFACGLAVVGVALVSEGAATRAHARNTAAATPLNVNLVANSSFEVPTTPIPDGYKVAPIPRWKTANNFTLSPYGAPNTPSPAKSKQIGGGEYFAFGGPGTPQSQASQLISLSGRSAQVDQGKLTASASAYMWGYDSQGDYAQVFVRFLDSKRKAIGVMKSAPVAVAGELNKMLFKSVSAQVPAGTRYLLVVLVAVRKAGSYNDGAFDKIDVRIKG